MLDAEEKEEPDNMSGINWPQLAGALLGGGAAGALITAVVSIYRARPQPVGRRIDVVPVFRPSGNAEQLEAVIALTHTGKTVTFKNLFLAEVQVVNKGNHDLDELKFGVTLGDGDRCVFVEATPPDRHHNVSLGGPVTPDAPQHEIDFVLKPFNRRDSYLFKLYLVIPEGRRKPQDIVLGSASPIRFVSMLTAAEIFEGARSPLVVFRLGPIQLRIPL